MRNKKWTEKDIEYLCENWGNRSISQISKALDRSECAISAKAIRLNLGAFLDSGDYITLNQLYKAFGEFYSDNRFKKHKLPIIYKRVKDHSFRVVKIDKFWKWAYDNQKRLDFSKLEPNLLGHEPEWVKLKRSADVVKKSIATSTAKSRKWETKDDEKLLFYLKSYRYTAEQIALMMNRTECAIISRISTLKIKYRPLINDKRASLWTEEEKEKLLQMIKGNSNYTAIKHELSRHSEKAIRGYAYRKWGTEDLDKIRKVIDD